MELHADFAVSVSKHMLVTTTADPGDGIGPIHGQVISLGWWVQPNTDRDPTHHPTGTLYLVVDERRPRPMWVKQDDLSTVRLTE